MLRLPLRLGPAPARAREEEEQGPLVLGADETPTAQAEHEGATAAKDRLSLYFGNSSWIATRKDHSGPPAGRSTL